MDIAQILSAAEKGNLESCVSCPWSPAREVSVGFGVSCSIHGMDWHLNNKANSMIIVQDPGDTTPHHTGRLCAVCNAVNPSDKTAQQGLQLWNAAVSMTHNDPTAGGYLKQHYWTNSIMHGPSAKTGLRKKSTMKAARKSCSGMLALQIEALRPNVVVAKGAAAVNSLHEIGVLTTNWSIIRHQFTKGAYREEVTSWRRLPRFTVFCTYHTSSRVVNQTLSKLYNPAEIEKCINEKVCNFSPHDSIDRFLSTYENPEYNARAAGMRFLLNHWLDIGIEIRRSANEKT
jgi:uracil-DNA glycosylase